MAHLAGCQSMAGAVMGQSVRLGVRGHQLTRLNLQSPHHLPSRRTIALPSRSRQFSTSVSRSADDSQPANKRFDFAKPPAQPSSSSTSTPPTPNSPAAINQALMDLFPRSQSLRMVSNTRKALRDMSSPQGALQDNSYRVPEPLHIKPGPALGKTITISQSMPVQRAFSRLGGVVNKENVRFQMFQQKFHERPGLKRKRLRRSRWEKKFKKGFFELLTKVKEMKSHGW